MKRHEALIALVVGYALLTAGAVIEFGHYALMGAGVLLGLIVSFANTRE